MPVNLPIETERLSVRSFDPAADSLAMFGVYGDPEVMRFIPGGALADLDAVSRLLDNARLGMRRIERITAHGRPHVLFAAT